MNCIYCHKQLVRSWNPRCDTCDVQYTTTSNEEIINLSFSKINYQLLISITHPSMTLYKDGFYEKVMSVPYLKWIFPSNVMLWMFKIHKIRAFL